MAANPLTTWWGKNRKTVIIAGVVIIVLYGCLKSGGAADTQEREIPNRYASEGRVLQVHAQRNAKDPLPLVIVLPDNNTKTKTFETDSEVSDLANQKDFALVYAEPVGGEWRVDPAGADAQYLKDIITYVSNDWTAIDPARIYIWGLGEGARQALAVACANPGQFAAIGVVGQFAPDPGPDCGAQVPTAREREASWDEEVSKRLWSFSENKIRGS
ncbi:hypothetical protein I6A84_37840 [Frankia sp. CNm7]|uniref:Plasmid partitioning protein n=1 Tax=Frankia nepalensis TaxID=1836974 RepID=A0A937RFG3_9ACTN|nr:hypothetical protein [Frankia nepalensis]MBL7499638.1 hypothetical protein [Frankia nepalensis]MBL7514441.1 hypothetical protein [Frankia nepalensis]MBL7523650.1 hypothetical protein [Frankia nepalensis]MBL7628015.1 hypothetical protein [Frankia nepalensis]